MPRSAQCSVVEQRRSRAGPPPPRHQLRAVRTRPFHLRDAGTAAEPRQRQQQSKHIRPEDAYAATRARAEKRSSTVRHSASQDRAADAIPLLLSTRCSTAAVQPPRRPLACRAFVSHAGTARPSTLARAREVACRERTPCVLLPPAPPASVPSPLRCGLSCWRPWRVSHRQREALFWNVPARPGSIIPGIQQHHL
jgi:hypothetical protein